LSARSEDPELARATARLDAVVRRMHESILMIRMQPVGQLWERVPRLVRDLSRQLGREVEVTLVGEDTRFERSMLEALKAPLVHLLRNCLDHGIEPPEDRIAAGKPATGQLTLRAGAQDGAGVLEISDDGRGIDRGRLVASARRNGLIGPDEDPDGDEALQLIFRSGFSTAQNLTHVSGRGVGMDVVLTNIEGIGGTVEVISEVGVGTIFRIRVPGAAVGPGA
jgi:two-component system chemotaxis sensor kinase CheA